jgi:hypothetical protein
MADITLKDTDGDPSATVGFVDADNNATSPADTPVWTSSDESVATVSASADGLSATVAKTGTTGATIIGVDAHNDDGVDIHAQATLTVVASEAVSGEVTLTPAAAPAPPVEAPAPAADGSPPEPADPSATVTSP